MTSVDIWEERERPQTLADISFAPTSISNIEFPDDIEPVAFQANRAALAANGADELRELQSLNQQTTAYPSISCTTGPMVPMHTGGPACDVASMQERSHGITAYVAGNPLLTQFDEDRADTCASMEAAGVGMVPSETGDPPIGYTPNSYSIMRKPRARHITTRMANSLRGALYDMQHFNELPPARSGESPGSVARFVVSRDNRTPYLLLVLTFILVLTGVVLGVRSQGTKK